MTSPTTAAPTTAAPPTAPPLAAGGLTAASLARLLLLAALWGASFLFMRIAAPVFGALPTTLGRLALAVAGLGALVAARRLPTGLHGRAGQALAIGAISSALPFVLFAFAAQRLPTAYSAIVNALTPLMGVAVGAAFFGERPTAAKLGGVALGFAGVVVLARAGPVALDASTLAGLAACLAATVCYGVAGLLAQRLGASLAAAGAPIDSRVLAFASQVGALLTVALMVAIATLASPATAPMSGAAAAPPAAWAALAALGLASTALAYVLYFRLIADVGAVRAMTVTFLIPLFGAVFGWAFLGERLTWAHAAGGGLIGLALVAVTRGRR